MLEALKNFNDRYGIHAISVTTHGACGALISADGSLATPILDYEYAGPDEGSKAYDMIRPSFEETGSPRLPMGLNVGAQLYWQFLKDPDLRERATSFVTYPQYWSHRLTGTLACDVSSLGCHTDLWNPQEARFSSLVEQLGITDKMAPARRAAEILGPILPEVAAKTGIDPTTPVHCGIHDSNASLLPHVMRREPPFSVVSTGTWVIVMTVGGADVRLDQSRDTLINVNALGAPVPSARFMGGREFEIIRDGHSTVVTDDVASSVAANGPFLLPAVVGDSGPYQGHRHSWIGPEPRPGSPERIAALSFYLAMMTAECLKLTGHQGSIVVEGPFAANPDYCQMLAAATNCRVHTSKNTIGTSQGAAMLAVSPDTVPIPKETAHYSPDNRKPFASYAERWRKSVRD